MTKKLDNLIAALEVIDSSFTEIIENDLVKQPTYLNIFDFKYIFTRGYYCLYANAPALYRLGVSSREIVGKELEDMGIPPETVITLKQGIDQVFHKACSVKGRTTAECHTEYGASYYEFSLSPLFNEKQEIEAVLCTVKDVTEQKDNKDRYLREVIKLKQIIDGIPIPLVEVDRNGTIVKVNNAFFDYDFKGFKREDALGKPFKMFMDMTNHDYTKTGLYAALQGRSVRQKYVKGGNNSWLMSAVPLYDDSGVISGAVGVYENITEHEKNKLATEKKQEMLLKRFLAENKKLTQLIGHANVGIVFIDAYGFIEEINDFYLQSFLPGCRKAMFIGKHASELISQLEIQWEESTLYQALQGHAVENHFRKWRDKSLLVSAIPVYDQTEQKAVGALSIVYDITDRERFSEELKKLDRLHVVGEIAAGVAHEIRNPMTVIKGYLQRFLLKAHENCPNKEQLNIVMEELGHVETIVTDFLSLANNKATSMACRNLNNVITSIEPLVRSHAIEQGIEVDIVLEGNLPSIQLDLKEIKQLLINLTRNAVEAMSKHGVLTIRTRSEERYVIAEVEDTGPGIPPETICKVFNPFFTTKENGTGLGLSICASIVERHSGNIKIQSELGVGTKFVISFPRCC